MLTDTAVIVAGGKSSRMGFDKQCIRLEGKLLIEQQLISLREVFDEIIIVTNKPEQYKGMNCILTEDELVDFGPLGGIHAGLKAAGSPFCYFIACDMPELNKDYILYMRGLIHSVERKPDAVATRYGDWLEPFNAFYSKALLPYIEKAYLTDGRKISRLLEAVDTLYIEERIARSFSPDWSMFFNINNLADLRRFSESLRHRKEV